MSDWSHWLMKLIFRDLKYAQSLYEDEISGRVNQETSWLDMGCGHQILSPWRLDREKRLVETAATVIGIDMDRPALEEHLTLTNLVHGDIEALPFKGNTFSLISSNMVLEHVERPVLLFKEAARVLRPGGKFLFHTPNLYGYDTTASRLLPERVKPFLVRLLEGRAEEDVYPTHYRCNSEKMIRKLATESNLRVVKIKHTLDTPLFLFFPPFALIELLYLRLTSARWARKLRSNLIAILEKPESPE